MTHVIANGLTVAVVAITASTFNQSQETNMTGYEIAIIILACGFSAFLIIKALKYKAPETIINNTYEN